MNKGIYKIAVLISLATLISCLLSGISLETSLVRTVLVFLGILFVFAIFMQLLRWGLGSNYFVQKEETPSEEKVNNE